MSDSAAQPAPPAGVPAPNGAPPKRYLCPYCGAVTADARRCSSCGGHLDPLSRQATQNTMGPWQVHDTANPFRPGCSFATVRKMVERGQITRRTILRGPTTRQFWTFADRTPSVANLLGVCHNCHTEVAPEAFLCAACGASFTPETDRQYLGLAPRRPLPGEAPADEVAHLASDGAGLLDRRRRPDEESPGGAPARVQRPAFPADPRPARARRSALATAALVGVGAVIGLALGAAGALAVAESVGLIDLSGGDAAGGAAGAAPPSRGEALTAPADDAAEVGAADAAAREEDGEEVEAPPSEPPPGGLTEPADEPGPEPAPEIPEGGLPAPQEPATEPQSAPVPAPAVPPRLRRLP